VRWQDISEQLPVRLSFVPTMYWHGNVIAAACMLYAGAHVY
jgi:hypothetical protein